MQFVLLAVQGYNLEGGDESAPDREDLGVSKAKTDIGIWFALSFFLTHG